MEAAEKDCETLARKFNRARRRFSASDKGGENLHNSMYEDMIKEVENISDELVFNIELLTLEYKANLGDVDQEAGRHSQRWSDHDICAPSSDSGATAFVHCV